MMRFSLFLFLLLLYSDVFSQGFVHNNGAQISVTSGGLIIVKSDSLINSLSGSNGLIANSGQIIVEGNIHNQGVINGTSDSIKLTGDWINDDVYTGNNSWVDMYGANQLITGSAVTTFNNLALEGGAVTKRQTLNAITSGLLVLDDAELATDSNQMLVTNANTTAITWNTGYVSSVGPGNLARVTNSTGGYVFPTGSPSYINPPSIFRPVEMNPASNGSDTYGAALVKGNATNDGYNVADLDTVLCVVNPNFYHRLYQTNGSDAVTLAMYYDPSTDGSWTDEAHWKNSIWNDEGPSTQGSGLGLSTVSVAGINDFIPNPFALAEKRFAYNPGPTVTITVGQSTVLNPTVAAPAGATFVWSPDSALSCDNCPTPTADPTSDMHYTVAVTDKNGCTVKDTLDIIITGGLVMPDAFTPNGDGKNDFFGPVSLSPVTVKAFRIYNRWGQLIHNSTAYWDGTFKGNDQPVGTYLYYIEAESPSPSNPSTMVTYKQQGAVTLLR